MYINKIDELVDKIIDDFYNKIIVRKDVSKYFEEINFVKHQLEINKIFSDYIKNIDKEEINNILNDVENTNKIIEIIKRYIAYYIFMTFAFFYKSKYETYINNIIEFSKNQPGFNFRIDNFFNSESNGIIIRFFSLIKNIISLLEADSAKLSQLTKKSDYSESIKFLNDLGQDFINSNFKIENLNGNVKEQSHNIIKTIILTELYFKTDKKDVYQFLDKSEKEAGEFTYIDIVVPRTEFIDYNTIEMSLSTTDVENGLASEIYDLILLYEESERIKEITHEEKILELVNNKLLIPISEDFLLYHKDSEKYEKSLGVENVSTKTKKKDETKIKYIINKIDSVTDFFSKNVKDKLDLKKNIEKLFYAPLSDRRAILINNFEDIKIINKLQNQGRRAIENNEYYNDLLNYRQYPYINFKDFQKYGFNLVTNNTIDVIRSVSFEKINAENKNKLVHLRASSSGHSINIVGFAIPDKNSALQCLKLKDFIDIRKTGYKENGKTEKLNNGYTGTIKFLKNYIFGKEKKRPSLYWLFDIESDKVKFEKYDVATKLNDNENMKLIISKIYDDVIAMINNEIIKNINNKKEITLQKFEKLLKIYDKKIIDIPRNTDLYYDLEKIIFYEKVVKTIDKYDKKEDYFPGLFGDIIKLPQAPQKGPEKMPTILIDKEKKKLIKEDKENMEAEEIGAICQHNITWDNISALRKKNPNKFSELLFEFFYQYVIRNHEDDFICKSCGTQINLKNYALDGTYDDDGRFISFNMPMDVPIEDIPEYEKYKSTIRNLEKLIERIASISNINTLVGTSTTIKSRIKKIVKDSLDLIVIHNTNLKNIYKERSEKISSYGLNKDLSNLFIFELDNSIFVYSSKDKDYYKPIKRNNIIIYLMFLMILELSDTQLYYMTGDKICNYYLFSKFGINWFNGIQIRKNNQNVLTPILNYKVLCYIIFYMSCLLTKYNLWHFESEEPEKKKKFDPSVQRIIIHTFIDFVNSIIEIYSKKKKHYIYDIIANKFFQKLNSMFKNDDLLERIKLIEEKKIVLGEKKTRMISVKIKPILLDNEYSPSDYTGISQWLLCRISKSFLKRRIDTFKRYFEISNITNCEAGTFHKYSHATETGIITNISNNKLKCELCNKTIDQLSEDPVLAKTIADNFKLIKLQKIARKYCKSGELHNFIYETDKQCNICAKCQFVDTEKLNKKDLDELILNIEQMKQFKETKNKKDSFQTIGIPKEKEIYKTFIDEIKSLYGKSKQHKEDYFKFIDNFINHIESIIGKDINVDNKNIFLRYDSYIIDHDQNGYPLDKPFIINDTGNKIIFKKAHPFFKKDVIYYTNFKIQVDVFYDATTKLLLGFKEKNKDYQISKKQNIYLKVNNSIMNQIKMLGYPSKFIYIKNKLDYYKNLYKDPSLSLKFVISDVSRDRIQKLKKIITDIQRYIYRLAYNYTVKPLDEENNPDKFIDKYKNKLNKMVLKKEKGDKFLNKWKAMKYNLFFEDITDKTINIDPESNYVTIDDVSLYDYTGNLLLFYIVHEMNKLLTINTDKFIKSTIAYLLLDIIVRLQEEFDEEKELTNTEIKRFKHTLTILDDREIEDITGETEGFYQELKDEDKDPSIINEINEELLEESQALDLEEGPENLDYEVEYESGVNYNTRYQEYSLEYELNLAERFENY